MGFLWSAIENRENPLQFECIINIIVYRSTLPIFPSIHPSKHLSTFPSILSIYPPLPHSLPPLDVFREDMWRRSSSFPSYLLSWSFGSAIAPAHLHPYLTSLPFILLLPLSNYFSSSTALLFLLSRQPPPHPCSSLPLPLSPSLPSTSFLDLLHILLGPPLPPLLLLLLTPPPP